MWIINSKVFGAEASVHEMRVLLQSVAALEYFREQACAEIT